MNEQDIRDLRAIIEAHPELVMEDETVLASIISYHDKNQSDKVVDLRGVLLDKMKTDLSSLELTHHMTISAAYDYINGINQIHRAVIALLECDGLGAVLECLDKQVCDILGLDDVKICIEMADMTARAPHPVLTTLPEGAIQNYIGEARNPNKILLRQSETVDSETGAVTKRGSEAVLPLALGDDFFPTVVILFSSRDDEFAPEKGTDVLRFFRDALSAIMRIWLT